MYLLHDIKHNKLDNSQEIPIQLLRISLEILEKVEILLFATGLPFLV